MTPRQTYLRRLISAWGKARFRGMITRHDGSLFWLTVLASDKMAARRRMAYSFGHFRISRISFVGIERSEK